MGPAAEAEVGFSGRWMSYSSGRSHRSGSRLAAPRQRWSTEPFGDVGAVQLDVLGDPAGEHRVGRLQRTDSSMAAAAAPGRRARRRAARAPQERGERDAHLLPGGARPGRQQQVGEGRISASVSRWVTVLVGDLGLGQHADEVVLRVLAPGGHDRRHDLADRAGSLESRGRRAPGSTSMPKLPVIVSTGMAAQKSTLSSARPSSTNESISAWTVSSIHLLDPPLRPGRHERRLDQGPVAAVLRPRPWPAC